MNRIIGLSVMGIMSAISLPTAALAHDNGYVVCRDEDGDRTPCRPRRYVCRDEDGDRVPCGRSYYRYTTPSVTYYDYGPTTYYGYRYRQHRSDFYYGGPSISIGIGARGFYGRGW